MKEENNIDNLFREKLEGFSEEPPPFVWDGIRDQLAHGRRKKRVAWYSWSAVAALVLLAFMAGWYFNETNNKNSTGFAETGRSATERIVKPDTAEAASESGNGEQEDNANEPDRKLLAGGADSKSTGEKRTEGKQSLPETESVMPAARERIAPPARIKPVEALLIAQSAPEPEMEERVPAPETVFSDFERETINFNAIQYAAANTEKAGWKMGVNVSPGYSSYNAKHDVVYASNMTHEATEGNANMSGGISVRYRTAGRWSFESGVYYAQNGQQTGSSPQIFGGKAQADYSSSPAERLYFNTAVRMENSHMAMNSTAGVIEMENLPAGAEIAANLENTFAIGNSLLTQGELSQVFDLVEIPIYLRYLLLDSRLDVELVGGVSAGMVVGNNAYIDNQFGVQRIGKTQDISPVNMSGTVGVGFSYDLGKQLSLAVEPRFNYYLNSISRNPEVEFRPYRIGIYTGLYYTF